MYFFVFFNCNHLIKDNVKSETRLIVIVMLLNNSIKLSNILKKAVSLIVMRT